MLEIAKKYLNLTTLETRNWNSQDFSEQAVWNIRLALEKAYKLGYENALKKMSNGK